MGHRFWQRRLDLSAFTPLVVAGDGHERCSCTHRRAPHLLVVASAHAGFGVTLVPGSDLGVIVAWAHAGDEEQVVRRGEARHGGPIAYGAAVGETVRREVGVGSIEARVQELVA